MGKVRMQREPMRARERRIIEARLRDHHQRTSFEVIDLTDDRLESHGLFETLSEARGCVEFDGLTAYAIWRGNTRVECVE
jgi:hypothetical protein